MVGFSTSEFIKGAESEGTNLPQPRVEIGAGRGDCDTIPASEVRNLGAGIGG